MTLRCSITDSVILKFPTGDHRGQRARAIQDLLVQRVLLHNVRGYVTPVLARRKNLVTELLHMVELLAQEPKRIVIGIGCRGNGRQAEAFDGLRMVIGHPGLGNRGPVLNVIQERASPFPDVVIVSMAAFRKSLENPEFAG